MVASYPRRCEEAVREIITFIFSHTCVLARVAQLAFCSATACLMVMGCETGAATAPDPVMDAAVITQETLPCNRSSRNEVRCDETVTVHNICDDAGHCSERTPTLVFVCSSSGRVQVRRSGEGTCRVVQTGPDVPTSPPPSGEVRATYDLMPYGQAGWRLPDHWETPFPWHAGIFVTTSALEYQIGEGADMGGRVYCGSSVAAMYREEIDITGAVGGATNINYCCGLSYPRDRIDFVAYFDGSTTRQVIAENVVDVYGDTIHSGGTLTNIAGHRRMRFGIAMYYHCPEYHAEHLFIIDASLTIIRPGN